MRREPRVSAIMIFHQAERFMDEAIASVCAQAWRNWELLLVDDGSTDGRHGDRAPLGRAPSRPHPLLRARRPPEPRHERVARNARRRARARRLRRVPRRGRRLAAAQARDAGRHPRGASRRRRWSTGRRSTGTAGPAVRRTRGATTTATSASRRTRSPSRRDAAHDGAPERGRHDAGHLQPARAARGVRADRRVREGVPRRVRGPGLPREDVPADAHLRHRHVLGPLSPARGLVLRPGAQDGPLSSGAAASGATHVPRVAPRLPRARGRRRSRAARRASQGAAAVRSRAPVRLEVARPLRRSPRAPRARARARDPAAGTGVSRAPVGAGTAASGCLRSASSGSGASGGARR